MILDYSADFGIAPYCTQLLTIMVRVAAERQSSPKRAAVQQNGGVLRPTSHIRSDIDRPDPS
jgi:hypothetical protein